MKLRTLFGPVPSRRLGITLGIDIIPFKVCTMDCIYCQLGGTTKKTIKRKCYITPEELLNEWNQIGERIGKIDCIAISGSGEPTLNTQIGKIIEELKRRVNFPIAVLTNGSLLFQKEVQKEICSADIVLPSLDTVTEDTFERINRPHPSLTIMRIIEGLKKFRRIYQGKLWLEIMIIKDMNDRVDELELIRKAIYSIKPDKVQLNTVIRPGSEVGVEPVPLKDLRRIRDYFGNGCEIITSIKKKRCEGLSVKNLNEIIISVLKRHPLSMNELVKMLNKNQEEIINCVKQLQDRGLIGVNWHKGKKYLRIFREPSAASEFK